MNTGGMCFKVLGGVDWLLDGESLHIGRRRERLLLGLLLLDPGRPFRVNRLLELLWNGEKPPASSRNSLQVHISRLRRRFAQSGAAQHGFAISNGPESYVLEGDPAAVDLHRFRSLLHRAERADHPAECSQLLDRALAEWGGPVLDGSASEDLVRRLGIRTDETRLSAALLHAEARLALGLHTTVHQELAGLAVDHPHHERLATLRMLALHQSGHRDEALRVYEETRLRLAADLGLDPGTDLRKAHQSVLHATPPPPGLDGNRWRKRDVLPRSGTAAGHRPPESPLLCGRSPAGTFIGRTRELEQLAALAEEAMDGSGVVAIVGAAGNGKTALALHWARHGEAAFEDGKLFIDLRGHSRDSPLNPPEAQAVLLRSLGVDGARLPADETELAELYQRTLAGRRVLIVLDNAECARQVRPLLPAAPGSLALVTSRNRLGALIAGHAAGVLTLGPLSHGDAEALLGGIIGSGRAADEPGAVSDLVLLCGRSPLALRITAANLTMHPRCRIADYAVLVRSGDPLEGLAVQGDPDSAVRPAFELSYRRLAPAVRRLFRLLGLLPGSSTTVTAAAALAGLSRAETSRLLDTLFAEHLVEPDGCGRFQLHDLIRQYAGSLAEAEEPAGDRSAARRRLLRWYLATADAAARTLYPQILRLKLPPDDDPAGIPPAVEFNGPQEAAAWLDAEFPDLIALIAAATAVGTTDPAGWFLADALRGYFWMHRRSGSWQATARAALEAAERAHDPRGQATGHQSLGLACFTVGRTGQSVRHFERALSLARDAGWREYEAATLSNLAGILADLGDLNRAAAHYTEALAIIRALGHGRWQAPTLQGLSSTLHSLGQLAEADRLGRRALTCCQEIGATDAAARARNSLALIASDLGRPEEARRLAEEARQAFRALGNLAGEAEALSQLALVACETGDGREALRHGLAALKAGRTAGRPRSAFTASFALGHARHRLRQFDRALEHFRAAGRTAEEIGYRKGHTMALLGCAVSATRLGGLPEALAYTDRALALARASRLGIQEGQAHAVAALAHAEGGGHEAASSSRRLALDIYTATGYRPSRSPFALTWPDRTWLDLT